MSDLIDITPIAASLMAGKTIITPTLRLARRVKSAWAEQAQTPALLAPAVFALEGWLETRWRDAVDTGQLPAAKLMSRLEERLLWEQVIEQDLAQADSFSLLQPAKAAQQAMRSRQLLMDYCCDYNADDIADLFRDDPDCGAFLRWLIAFDRRLLVDSLTTSGDAQRALLSLTLSRPEAVVLFHCLDVPPLAARILSQLACSVEHVKPGVGNELAQSGAPPVFSLADAPALIGQTFADKRAELEAAAIWAAQRFQRGDGTTAVVLLDMENDRSLFEYCLRAEFDALDSRYHSLPVNFSKGIPLSDTPMYRDALGMLALLSESITRQKLLELLRSPYLVTQDLLTTEAGLLLIKHLFSLAQDPISLSDLSHHAAKLSLPLSDLLSTMRGMRLMSLKQDLWAWAEAFKSLLTLWQWPARPALDSLEHQQRERLDNVFDQFLQLSEVAGSVGYREALQLLRRTLSESVFQPKTDDNVLQVLGLREAVGLSFDAVWLCGMQSNMLPRPVALQSFIPPVLQNLLQLPDASSASVDSNAVALLRSFTRTHRGLHASWHKFEEGVEVLPSRLLSEHTPLIETGTSQVHWLPLETQRTAIEFVADTQAPVAALFEGKTSGGASLLKDQSQCPFRSWVAHRIGVRALDEVAFGLTHFERGALMHRALFTLWGDIDNLSQLRALDAGARSALIAAAVDEALINIGEHVRQRVGSACLDIERRHLRELLTTWLALEATRSVDFNVVAREAPVEVVVGPLRLSMRIDRVDQLANGRQLVIDYKSGGALSRSAWLGERPMDPQLPVYALQNQDIVGIAWGRVKNREAQFIALGEDLGLQKDEQLVEQMKRYQHSASDWSALRTDWRAVLDALAQEFTDGYAAITPQKTACNYCDYSSICRFQQSSDSVSEATADE